MHTTLLLGDGEKLGRLILSPPWLVKAQSPVEGYLGGEKLDRHILSPPPQGEASTLSLLWIRIQPLLFRGWGKNGRAHSFPTLTSESINLVQKLGYLGGEKLGRPILSPPRLGKVSTLHCQDWADPVFPHPLTSKGYMCIHDRVRLAVFFRRRLTICTTVFPHPITFWTKLMFNHVRVGKEWAGPVFPHPPTRNFRFYAYSWQGMVGGIFHCPNYHMHNNFSPPY